MKRNYFLFVLLCMSILVFLTYETTYCFMTFGETTEINFNTNGGNNIDNIVYSYGLNNLTNRLPVPSRDGYVFEGWYLEKTYNTEIKNVPFPEFDDDKIITLYAKWTYNNDNLKNNNNSFYIYGVLAIIIVIVIVSAFIKKRRKK